MGYPFDRLPRDKLNYIEDFITPNSRLFETKIKYTDVTRTVKNIKKPNEEVSIAKK